MKSKDRLLDITAELTCGVVNGCKVRVRRVIKPPWAEKRPVRDSGPPESSLDEDNAEPTSLLSKEQLKVLMNQQGWPHFKDVFMLSSVDREDVETLKVQDMWGYGHRKEMWGNYRKIQDVQFINTCCRHLQDTYNTLYVQLNIRPSICFQ